MYKYDVSIIPYSKSHLNNKLFNHDSSINNEFNIWNIIQKRVENKGFVVNTIDINKFKSKVYFYYNSYYLNLTPIIKSIFKPYTRLIYYHSEPEGILPLNKEKQIIKIIEFFDTVLTYDDDLVSEFKATKLNITLAKTDFIYNYHKSKLFLMMLSNKTSNHKNQIYSIRRSIISHMYQFYPNDFDLYGQGWDKFSLNNGWVEDKITTISNYNFMFCMENMENINGYISERLFDCYQALTVPVYLGANNILEYVPRNTIILLSDFKNLDSLINYLINISSGDYQQYLSNIELFRKSIEYDKFTAGIFVDEIAKELTSINANYKKRFKTLKFLLYFLFVNLKLLVLKVINRIYRFLKLV